MNTLDSIISGFYISLQPINLLYCFLGVLMGTLVGVLPGLGPAAALSLLLPIVYHIPPVSALIMLFGLCYGTAYGGSTTSILVNIPGELSSVVTCFDGYQMARQGRAGPALGIAAFGSFIAGTLGVIGLMLFAPLLADFALRFGPPEFFSLAVMSLTLVAYVGRGKILSGLMMACVGLLMSTVGMDTITAKPRLTFGFSSLLDGFELPFVAMGLFGLSEIFINLSKDVKSEVSEIFATKIKHLLPTRQDWKDSTKPILRGTAIGFFLGIIPGVGAAIPTFLSYAIEKKLSKNPDKFGKGAIEGVAGPESANNAAYDGTFVPMLSLGIPTNVSTSIILGVLMVLGIQPGPMLISSRPDVFWGVVSSMYIGNVMLLLLNLPLIGLWVQILKIPYSLLFPLIVLFCEIGAFSVNNSVTDVLLVNIFGVIGYIMRRYEFEGAPLLMALVLGPMIENSLRRSLIMSDGSFMIFLSRPLSVFFLLVAIFLILSPLITKKISKKTIN